MDKEAYVGYVAEEYLCDFNWQVKFVQCTDQNNLIYDVEGFGKVDINHGHNSFSVISGNHIGTTSVSSSDPYEIHIGHHWGCHSVGCEHLFYRGLWRRVFCLLGVRGI